MALVTLAGIRLDAHDVALVADYWAHVLGWDREARADGATAVVPPAGSAYPVIVVPADTPKRGQNRIHLDLTTSSPEAMAATIARGCSRGGHLVDIGQTPDEGHEVLADPEDNEFCVIPPDNGFLAGTGTVGAINCDGSQAVGYFWSAALDWPLVWDQDEETAIQSPAGGSKVTWSGPPLMPRTGRDRLRLELAATNGLDIAVAHLRSLGAVVSDSSEPGATIVLDPDGNEFHLMSRPS